VNRFEDLAPDEGKEGTTDESESVRSDGDFIVDDLEDPSDEFSG